MATDRKQFSVRLPAEAEELLHRLVVEMSEAAGTRVMITGVIVGAIEALAEKRGLLSKKPGRKKGGNG
jgi:hypothetical protein